MSAWNFMSYESKDNLLEAIRRESAGMFALAADRGSWEAPTGAGHWQVRDVFGHLIDTTETYFIGFDAALGDGEGPPQVPLTQMARHVDSGAQAFRSLEREDALSGCTRPLTRCSGSRRACPWTTGAFWSRTSTWVHCRRSSTRSSN